MFSIREFAPPDWPQVWSLLRATFASGDPYAFDPESTEAEIHSAWIQAPLRTLVAVAADGKVLGTYILKPNQPGLGSHVCNCGYVVASSARGRGVAQQMCEHSQALAKSLGFRAMQFNLVVVTNEAAVRLWQRLGFAVAAKLLLLVKKRLSFGQAPPSWHAASPLVHSLGTPSAVLRLWQRSPRGSR